MPSWFRRRGVVPLVIVAALWACGASEDGAGGTGPARPANGTTSSGGSGSPSASGSASGGGGGSSSGAPVDGGSPTDGAPAPGCYDYGAFSPKTVSFKNDVMPIFAARCASCHNDSTATTYYGANATAVYTKLLGGTPKQAPQLKFAAPNDPVRSYMLAKVEYTNPGGTCSLVKCTAPGCELFAPPGNPLPESERATLRSWIMRGALND